MDSKSDESFILFIKQRYLVNSLRRKASSDYYDNKLDQRKCNMKETWNILNEITGGKGKETTVDINLEGCNRGDSTEIVNKFSNFFSNIGYEMPAKNIRIFRIYSSLSSFYH